jgi:type II secretory pathway pseudopilin PulG
VRRRSAFTLVEIIITLSIFTLIGVLLATAFLGAGDIWRRVSSSTKVQTDLGRGRDRVNRDLKETSFDSVYRQAALSSLGAVDGDAVSFLSARDPATDEFVRKSDGTPLWQRNILYYLVVPSNHAGTFGTTCSGAADANGYEEQCPHKVLVRKVIDYGPPTDPTDESTEEAPMDPADLPNYLTRPSGFDTSGMNGEPGLEDVSLPATNLLGFQVQLSPDPRWPGEVKLTLKSVAEESAQREVSIGQTPLSQSTHTSSVEFSVFPEVP